MRGAVVAFCLLAAAAAQPKLVLTAPADGITPLYFSGTDCRANGYAADDGTFPMERPIAGRLYINGHLVAATQLDPEGQTTNLLLEVIWDSLRFINGTVATVTFEVDALGGPSYSAYYTAPVSNLSGVFADKTLEDAFPSPTGLEARGRYRTFF